MALSSGAGSEVQRPLATAVAVGIALGSLITLFVLPGIFVILLRGYRVARPASNSDIAQSFEANGDTVT